ncbi:MAG: hypothetical protein Q9157_003374 [Trypethelium eluteriae]
MRSTRSGDYELRIRQQPREALVAQDGKGKVSGCTANLPTQPKVSAQFGSTTSGDTPAPTTSLAQQPSLAYGYGGSGSQWAELPNKRQRHNEQSSYDFTRDPYRQLPGFDNRGVMYQNRQGAAYGDISHSRQSSQGQYPYPTPPQGSDMSSYYQGQSYTPSQSRMGLPYRTPEMMGHLTLDQATTSPTPGQMPSNRDNEFRGARTTEQAEDFGDPAIWARSWA